MKSRKIGMQFVLLAIFLVFGKFSGFIRELVLANVYGADKVSDAFIISFNIPYVLFYAFGVAVCNSFIPIYSRINTEKGQYESEKFVRRVMTIVVTFSLIATVILECNVERLVKLFAIGFDESTFELTCYLTYFLIPTITFICVSGLLNGYLQVKEYGHLTSIVSIPKNVIVIIAIILSSHYGVKILAVGSLIAWVSQVIIQIPFLVYLNYPFGLDFKFSYDVKMLLKNVVPVFLGLSLTQINLMIDRTLASTLGNGYVSILNYASKFNELILAIFGVAVSSIIFPKLSNYIAQKNEHDFNRLTISSMSLLMLVLIPISVFSCIMRKEIITILFGSGKLSSEVLTTTSTVFGIYAMGFAAIGFRDLLIKMYYSIGEYKVPMFINTFGVLINITLNLTLIRLFGVNGIAVATITASYFTNFVLFKYLTKLNETNLDFILVINRVGKYIISMVISCLVLISNRNSADNMIFRFIIDGVMFFACYLCCITYFYRNEIMKYYKECIRNGNRIWIRNQI
ncbi:murein biosynthesis integral membrane protein MurJ [Fusibacter sp. JL216-2]|uniref:murein biosynthesis integral membrane protein MurJ n=1 Tax=Fusibacter sp. JL216-2 TaxID=3071453 RepID=UPI003D353B16